MENYDYRANSVDLDEAAHHEPPHQDVCCLQNWNFLSLVLRMLKIFSCGWVFMRHAWIYCLHQPQRKLGFGDLDLIYRMHVIS